MRLTELAEEYDRSYRLLRNRIKELQTQLKGYALPEEYASLQTRIRELSAIAREVKETRDVCRDYYAKGVYINEAFTTRYLSVRPSGLSRVPPARVRRQQRPEKPVAKKPAAGDPRGIDTEATRNAADAILAELFSH